MACVQTVNQGMTASVLQDSREQTVRHVSFSCMMSQSMFSLSIALLQPYSAPLHLPGRIGPSLSALTYMYSKVPPHTNVHGLVNSFYIFRNPCQTLPVKPWIWLYPHSHCAHTITNWWKATELKIYRIANHIMHLIYGEYPNMTYM